MKEYKIVKLSSNPKDRNSGIKDLMAILRNQNVSSSTLKFIEKSVLEGDTSHATFKSEARHLIRTQIDTDKKIRNWLRKIYYFDFIIFGFDTEFIDN